MLLKKTRNNKDRFNRHKRKIKFRNSNVGKAIGRDGVVTKIAESVPVIGYIPTALHAATGNKDHANRSLAKCTNATITATSGLVGFAIGGVTGGGYGGAIGAIIGSVAEKAISTTIKDQNIKLECDEFVPKDVGYNMLFGAIGGAGGGAISKYGKSVGVSSKKIIAGRIVNGTVFGIQKKILKCV
eukprot:798095_1